MMRICKRLTAWVLTLAIVTTLFAGLVPVASAAESAWTKTSLASVTANDTIAIVVTTTNGSYILGSANGSSRAPTATAASFDASGNLLADPAGFGWNVSGSAGDGYTFTVAGGTAALYCTNKSDGVRVGTSSNNVFTINGNYLYNTGTNRYIGVYNKQNFRCYTNTTSNIKNQTTAFYKLQSGGDTPTQYAVTLNQNSGGTIAADKATAAAGETVTLTATANSGYAFVSWTVLDGNAAEVTVTNHQFVMPASNVEVEATFTEKAQTNYTVSFFDFANDLTDAQTVSEGGTAVEPTKPNAPDGYTFMGWSAAELETPSDTAPVFYNFAAAVTGNLDLYAVYAKSTTSGSSDTYTLVTREDELTVGDSYILVGGPFNGSYDAASSTLSGGYLSKLDISAPVDNQVTISDTSLAVFKLGGEKDAWTLTFGTDTLSVSSAANLSKSETDNTWKITISDGDATISNNGYASSYRILYNAASPRFKPYTSAINASMQLPHLYKQGGTTYSGYTTSPKAVTYYSITLDTVTGGTITASKTTAAAGEIIQLTATPETDYRFAGWQVIDNYGDVAVTAENTFVMPASDVIVSATFTKQEVYSITVTQAAGGTLTASAATATEGTEITLTAAPDAHYRFTGWSVTGATVTGSDLSVTFSMPANPVTVTGTFEEEEKATVSFLANGTTVYTVTDYVGSALQAPTSVPEEAGFTFLGWVSGTYADTAAPTLLNPTEIPSGGMTYYAVYGEQGSGSGDEYTLVKDVNQLTVGASIVIAAMAYDYAMGTQNSSNRAQAAVTKNGDILTITNSVQEFTLEEGTTDGTFSFRTNAGYIYAASSSSNQLKTQTTKSANSSWAISIASDGTASVVAQGSNSRNVLQYNQSSRLFACYNSASQKAVALYQKGGYTYYTTTPVAVETYTITWIVDGETYTTTQVRQGETPTAPATAPEKADNGETYYTFVGWAGTEGGAALPAFPAAAANVSYYAVFEAKQYQYTASITGSESVRLGKTRSWSSDLTASPEKELTGYTVEWSSNAEQIASVSAEGVVTGVGLGSAEITVTYKNAAGEVLAAATKTITVIETAANVGGYTLITNDNIPSDWSGDYVIAGRAGGHTSEANDYVFLTPVFTDGVPSLPTNFVNVYRMQNQNIDGDTMTADLYQNMDSSVSGGTIEMFANGDTSYTEDGVETPIFNVITQIDDKYIFTVECVDDVNQLYTVRVKDSSLYLAASESTSTGNNSLNFSMTATDLAIWEFSVLHDEESIPGYSNDIIQMVCHGNSTRWLLFNNQSNGQFRDYVVKGKEGQLGSKNANGVVSYNLYFFGNPNPFYAQIFYQGEQKTIQNPVTIHAGRTAPVDLKSRLLPDINDYPNWEITGGPVWSLTENASGMTIDSNTGELLIHDAAEGSYALVTVSYTVYDKINGISHNVSTAAKVLVDAQLSTYSTVIYEDASGSKTEVSYTVTTDFSKLPLAAYVVDDTTGGGSLDEASGVVMGGTVSWSAEIAGTTTSVPIDENGVLDLSGVTDECIISVTATGATGSTNGSSAVNAKDATFKVYVKKVDYTVQILHNGTETGDFTVPASTTSVLLNKLVTNGSGETQHGTSFTISGGKWSIMGATHGASVGMTDGVLDLTGCDRSETFQIQVLISGITATTTPTDGSTPIVTPNLSAVVTVTVEKRSVDVQLADDTVVLDYDRSVTFDVLANDSLNGLKVTALAVSDGAPVTVGADFRLTYQPDGLLEQTITFTYTVTLSDDRQLSATVTIIPHESVYYEDSNSAFTYTDGKRGYWQILGTENVLAQSDPLTSTDIFGYDANYAGCATYSAGSTHMVSVSKQILTNRPDDGAAIDQSVVNPKVSFAFYGTGFDAVSLTSNNTGIFKVTVDGKPSVVQTYYGYTYHETPIEVTEYASYDRYKKNEDGSYTKWDGVADPTDYCYIAKYTNPVEYVYVAVFYARSADGSYVESATGTYVKNTVTTNWEKTDAGDNSLYQIPVLKVTDLAYAKHTVVIEAVYSQGFDIQLDGEYDFYFDAIRIHNPIGNAAEYEYLSIRDELIEDDDFGSGTATPCSHESLSDWEFNTAATYSASETANGRGTYAKRCATCGKIVQTAPFYVTATPDATVLHSEGTDAPATTTLRFTLSSENADIQAKLDALTLSTYWRSSNEAVFTCKNFGASVRANGAGEAYATLQIKTSDGTILARAIHAPTITVSGCSHTHTTTTVPATCQTEGSITYTCSKCGYSYTETLEKVAHSNTYQYNETEHWGVCKWCQTETNRAQHSMTSEQTDEGIRLTCTVCGYSYVESSGGHIHAAALSEAAKAPTCTAKGNIAYWMCECGAFFSDEACTREVTESAIELAPLGHDYRYSYEDEDMHAVTCSRCTLNDLAGCTYVDGVCSLCGHKKAVSYTATFVVPAGQSAPQACSGGVITLPSADPYTENGVTYTFLGWADEAITGKTETAPSYQEAGAQYTLTGDHVFYALYSHVETVGGNGDYVKVTTAPSDWSGEYLIVYEAGGVAFDGSLTTLDANDNCVTVSIENNAIAASDELDKSRFVLAQSGDAYTIQSASGYYIGTTSNKNTLLSSTSTAYTNTLSLDSDGNATILSSGGAYLRFNAASNQNRFRYYKSGSYTAQKAIALYGKTASGEGTSVTYYTTAAAENSQSAAEAAITRNAGTAGNETPRTSENYAGAAFVDGFGTTGTVADMALYGPKNEVYLANGQAIVFYLVGDKAVSELQIGAKAVTGTANLKITALNNPDTVALDRALATNTEMYYEFGAKIGWTGGISNAIVIQNTGSGILSITNLRYKAAAGTLNFFVNSGSVQLARQLVETGNSDLCAEGHTWLESGITNPTCEGYGSTQYVCEICGKTHSEPILPLGHTWGEAVVTKEATCSEYGELTQTCEICGKQSVSQLDKIPASEVYQDLNPDAWYYSGAAFAVANGIMTGTAEGSFSPNMEMSRAMMVQVLYALAGKPTHGENNPFSDVNAEAWYYDAVLWAAENGIVAGSNGKFDPNGISNREQTVTILYAFAAKQGLDTSAHADLTKYEDVSDLSSWAEAQMAWAVANGLISGTSRVRLQLSPKAGATRAQLATILQQFCKIFLAHS